MATSGIAGYGVLALVAVINSQILEEWYLHFRSGMCGVRATLDRFEDNSENKNTLQSLLCLLRASTSSILGIWTLNCLLLTCWVTPQGEDESFFPNICFTTKWTEIY